MKAMKFTSNKKSCESCKTMCIACPHGRVVDILGFLNVGAMPTAVIAYEDGQMETCSLDRLIYIKEEGK